MQFQVPQFTELEDKVIGPLTLKQFLYLLGAGVIIFILYKFLNLFLVIILSIPVAGVAILLAFVKVNNQPFISTAKNFFGFLRKPDFYVWRKSISKTKKQEEIPLIIEKAPTKQKIKPVSKESLQDLGWRVEIEK
jgi:hypothetical protein